MSSANSSLGMTVGAIALSVVVGGGATLLYYKSKGSNPWSDHGGTASLRAPSDDAPRVASAEVEELLGKLQQARRDLERAVAVPPRGKNLSQEMTANSAAQSVQQVVEQCDAIIAREDASSDQLSRARQAKLIALGIGAVRLPNEFAEQADTYARQLIDKHPGSNEAAQAFAYRFTSQYLRTRHRVNKEAIAELVKFAREYPKNELAAVLFRNLAQQQSALNNRADAIQVTRIGIKACQRNPHVMLLHQHLESLEESTRQRQVTTTSPVSSYRSGLPKPSVDYGSEPSRLLGMKMSVSGPTLRNGFVTLDSYYGKVVLVDFWATWCGPCRREMPTVRRLHETYGKAGFVVVGVSLDTDRDKLFNFVQSNDLDWPQIFVPPNGDSGWDNPIAKTYEVKSIPRTFLVSRRGTIVAIGLRGEALETAIVSELAK